MNVTNALDVQLSLVRNSSDDSLSFLSDACTRMET